MDEGKAQNWWMNGIKSTKVIAAEFEDGDIHVLDFELKRRT